MPETTKKPTNQINWKELLERLKGLGVSVAYTKGDNEAFLLRNLGRCALYYPLPTHFCSSEPNLSGYPGGFVIDSICRQLKIDRAKELKGWYDVL
jgi:hypothetical protein